MRRIVLHVKGALSYPQPRLLMLGPTRRSASVTMAGMNGVMHRDWIPYAAAAVIAAAIAVGFWLSGA